MNSNWADLVANLSEEHRTQFEAQVAQGLWNIEAPLRPYPPPSPPSPICVYDSTSDIHYCDFMDTCPQTANWDMLQYRVDIDYSWSCMGMLKICMFHRFCDRCQRDLNLVYPSLGVKMPGLLTDDLHKPCNWNGVAHKPCNWNACIDCFRWWNLHDNPNRDDITGADQININTFLDRWFGVTGPYANRLLDFE